MAATVQFTDNTASTSDLTTYTFTDRAIGTAAATRVVIVGVGFFASGASVASMTIGGISAAMQQAQVFTNGGDEIWTAVVPTGTTATIVITFSSGANRCAIGVWSAYGTSGATKYDGANATGTVSSTTAVDIPAGGVAVGFGYSNSNTTSTWSGLTEDFDTTAESRNYTGASDAFATLQSGPTISNTFATGSNCGISVISLSPAISITVDADSFALTAADTGLRVARKITAIAADFELTGTDASLERGLEIDVASASFILTGADVTLTYFSGLFITADPASFSFTGDNATLLIGRNIVASTGAFSLSGTAAALEYGRLLAASPGAFMLTGSDATIAKAVIRESAATLPVFGTWPVTVKTYAPTLKVLSEIAALQAAPSFTIRPLKVAASQSIPLRVRQRFST